MFLFILGTLFLSLSSCSDDDNGTSDLGTGNVTGVITDDYDAPLSGVTVTVEGTDLTTTTDNNGEYTLENVPVAKNIVTFSKTDYQTISVTVTPKSFSGKTALVNAFMEYAAARIEGKVLDAQNGNAPLPGVKVSITDALSTTTNSDGTFAITNLPLKDYTVTFTINGYETVTRNVNIDTFVDGVATLEVTMGGTQILPHKTLEDLLNSDLWWWSEIRGGRNAESYPHWDWSTDFMATLDFYGDWEEQNEGTTLRIMNDTESQSNPADLNHFDTYVFGRKHITEENKIMTVQCRTHNATADDPTVWGVQVVDLSQASPQATKLGDNHTLAQENYASVSFDLSDYVGKDIVIAIGTYRAKTGDYWKQFVLRRIAFNNVAVPENDWGWLSGTPINTEMENWALTQEMVRSAMPINKWSFTGVSPQSGSRDNYGLAYHSWRDVNHIAANWSFVPLHKDTEPFAGEGFVMKTNGGGTSVSLTEPQAYFYGKFAIDASHANMALRCRNFDGTNATYVKLTAIDDDMNVTQIVPSSSSVADSWGQADEGAFWFIHQNGGAGDEASYALFNFDLSQFVGKNVTLVLGVYKGTDNNNENKLCIYSINFN